MKASQRRRSLALGISSLLLAACGGGGGGSPPPPKGDGTFRPALQPILGTGQRPTAMVTADFNGDGVPDLAVGNHLGDSVSIFRGMGDGTFTPMDLLPLQPGSGLFDLRAGLINADAFLDLVTANSFTNTVNVFLGDGDGTFTAAPTVVVPAGNKIHGVALADFDDDGKLDLAASALTTNQVSILLGAGDGTFAFEDAVSVSTGARQVIAADFDEDGIPDLATASFDAATISIHLSNGDGSFVEAAGSPVSVGIHPWNLAVADFNGDGHSDLAAPGDQENAVRILLGTGNGTFTLPTPASTPVGASPYGIAAGDFSGDGAPDLAVANFSDNTASILLGAGLGTFAQATTPTVTTGAQPYAVAVADLDLDGILDLLVANEDDSTVSVFLGNAQ